MEYEFKNNVLSIINDDDQKSVHLLQPHWPNGDAWEGDEAKVWAEQYLLSLRDPNAELPGPSRENPTVKRATAEELESFRNSQPIPLTPAMLEQIVAERVAAALAERGVE